MIAARVAPGVRLSWLGRPRLDGDPVSGALMEGDHRGLRFAETPPPQRAESVQRSRRNTAFGATGPYDRVGSRSPVTDAAPLRDGRVRACEARDRIRAAPAAARLSPTREDASCRAL